MTRVALRPSPDEASAAGLSAALFAVAFPPFPFVAPAFVCLVPLAVAVARAADRGRGVASATRTAFWFGALGYACNLYWIASALSVSSPLAVAGYTASVGILAALVALAGALLFAARRSTPLPLAVALPLVWVALEVALSNLGELSFPWLPLGLATADAPVLAQIAELSGVRGVSFWIAATNGLIADAWLTWTGARSGQEEANDAAMRGSPLLAPRPHAARALGPVAAAIGLAAAVALYGVWRQRTLALRPVARIAVLQPNVLRDEKWRVEHRARTAGVLAAMTRDAVRADEVQLVVWPETALPGDAARLPEWRDTLAAVGADARTPILFGTLESDAARGGAVYNSAMLTDVRGSLGGQPAHRKAFLVPVIERLPFAGLLPLPASWVEAGFARGGASRPYLLPFGRVGALICFEAIFPQLARQHRLRGADVLVTISDDAWLGRSVAPHQHRAHVVLRAIENRVGIVRSANSGVSAYIDPVGRVHGATGLFTSVTRAFDVATSTARTPYTRLGDWLGALSAAAAALIAALALRRAPARRT